jgi:hypothetical protein
MKTTFADWLKSKGACTEGYSAHSHQTEQEFWNNCERGDWMLWVVKNKYPEEGWPDHKTLAMISCRFARRVLKYVPKGEDRPRLAIEAAEKWIENPTEENRYAANAAANAAYAAARAAAVNAASAAADAAASAAYTAARAAAVNAANAVYAAYTAYTAYTSADAYAAAAERKVQADIIRELWPRVGK